MDPTKRELARRLDRIFKAQAELYHALVAHHKRMDDWHRWTYAEQRHASSMGTQIEQLKNYNSVVLAIGYAGFFGVWSFLQGFLPEKAHVLAAILVASSLIIFVFWEVCSTLVLSHSTIRHEEQRERNENQTESSLARFIHKAFLPVWVITFALGFAGSILLYYNAIAALSGLEMWPR